MVTNTLFVFSLQNLFSIVSGAAIFLTGLGIGYGAAPAKTINVTDYGATANDSSNDSVAIQRALDAAASGSTVSFPAGVLLLDAPISPKSGTILVGTGTSTVLRFNGNTTFSMIRLVNVSNVEISAMTIDGYNSALVAHGIEAYNGSGHNLHNLTIQNMQNPNGSLGILFSGQGGNRSNPYGVVDSVIADNVITNMSVTSAWGGGIRLAWASSRNQVLRNRISKTGRGGIFANDGSLDLIIRGNTVSESGLMEQKLGIEVWGQCDRVVIEDNVIDHWLSVGGGDAVAVRRNKVQDVAGAAATAAFIGLEMICSNCVATDNLIDHNQQLGISISNNAPNQYQYYAYNTIQYMRTWGIQIQGDQGQTGNLYFYKNTFSNTLRNAGGLYSPADGRGFRFNDNVYGVTLDSNTITNNQNDGLQFSMYLDQVSAVNNVITNNLGAGVTPYAGADLEWSGNTVTGNATNTQPAAKGFAAGKPTANFATGGTVTGQAVTFTNQSTDPSGSISHVLWDFGEGTPSMTMNPSHTYAAAGSYRVTLVVWNAAKRAARVEKTIQVTDPKGKSGK